MEERDFYNHEGTVTFIPERLNKFPVVLRGLTSDELIVTFVAGLIVGTVIGIMVFIIVGKAFLIPTSMMLVTAIALWITSTTLRRAKRNKPDTWFYRKSSGLPSLGGGTNWVRHSLFVRVIGLSDVQNLFVKNLLIN